MLATTLAAPAVAGYAAPVPLARAIGLALGVTGSDRAGESGESGEGGEAGAVVPSQYELFLTEGAIAPYDANAQIAAYVDHAGSAYRESLKSLESLAEAVDALLGTPDQAHLDAARTAWLQARRPYLRTEAFRFYGGPIDGPARDGHAAGPEPRINAWPLNEAVIDYVAGDPDAGLVHAFDVPISRATILGRDQVSDESDVTTGWHAIEFLLWGQDRAADGPGARPPADYVAGTPANDRRRAYLRELVALLRDDLAMLARAWDVRRDDSYAQGFAHLPQTESLGRMLAGAATLAGVELAAERITVALDSGSQEDEQSCFSDSTRQDFVEGLAGIHAIWLAGSGSRPDTSLAALVAARDGALATRMQRLFADAHARVGAIATPFDRVLAQPPDASARADAEAAATALRALASGLRDVGRSLGVLVIVPGV